MSKKLFIYTLIITLTFSFQARSAVTEVTGCNLKNGATTEDVIAMSALMNEIMDSDNYKEPRFGQLVL